MCTVCPTPPPLAPQRALVRAPAPWRSSSWIISSLASSQSMARWSGVASPPCSIASVSPLAFWRQPVSYTHLRAHETLMNL
eukprot:2327142-Prymnesium_polylepis.1